jgi:hypothetical protein
VRFISYTRAAQAAYGVLTPDAGGVIELGAAGIAPDLEAFVTLGAAGLARLRDWLAAGTRAATPLAGVTIVAPFPQPTRTILCVGKNYRGISRQRVRLDRWSDGDSRCADHLCQASLVGHRT